jgi:predicted NBD/HSP70 family sugar kinase
VVSPNRYPAMLTGTNLTYTKEYNLRIVHETIRLHGPLSRADIARRTELTVQTVSNLVKQLLALDLVYEAERRREGRGAPSVNLALNADGGYAIGLDLDRDHVTGVLVDLAGRECERVHHELHFPPPLEAFEMMAATVEDLLQRSGLPLERLWGIGIGVPGPMHQAPDDSGTYLINPKAFPGWHDVPLADWMFKRFQIPVFVENNATAAAIGERWYGGAQRTASFFYFYFGSGLGGGLFLHGQPYEGFSGNAGEIGYLPSILTPESGNGDDPPHVGLHFYMPRLFERLREAGKTLHTPDDLETLLAEECPILDEWIETGARHLCTLSLAIEYIIDPEAIFFGGRLPDPILEALMNRVTELLPKRRIGGKVSVPKHELATAGVDAAALGVATIPFYEFSAPMPKVLLKQGEHVSPTRLLPRVANG